MRRTIVVTIALLAASIAAADTPEDALKYRKATMDTMAGHITALSLIAEGRVGRPEYLVSHADALAAGADSVGKLFPAGSAVGKSEALPLIWQEPEKFQKAAENVKVAAGHLRDAVMRRDLPEIRRLLRTVGDACKACHDRYRKEED